MDFIPVLIFLVAAILVVGVSVTLNRFLAPKIPSPLKYTTYECGEEIKGQSWVRFNSRFYVIGLIFLIFDIEVVMLLPYAVIAKEIGWIGWVEAILFLFILIPGLAYVWKRGDLEWIRPLAPKSAEEMLRAPHAKTVTNKPAEQV
ncbi:MAG: NADH-quinone oxidoreductase subunit A [bacterium]|nr:NADH-quinone oxidoreductase subunit A [bacterium]